MGSPTFQDARLWLTSQTPYLYSTSDVECYQIEWQGLFSFDEAKRHSAAREMGVYVAYECKGNTIKNMRYIGRSKELGQRVGTYRQNLAHFLSEKDMGKYRFALGTVFSFEKSIPSQEITPPTTG
jgi:hypothetical protein